MPVSTNHWNGDPTTQFQRTLSSLVNSFNAEVREEVVSLIPSAPKPGNFYTLPKIHKLKSLVSKEQPNTDDLQDHEVFEITRQQRILVPGRPIVSGIGTLTEYISAYVDRFLQPLLFTIPSYIQDSTDFLNKLNAIPSLDEGVILVTMDVSALHTNIPHDEGVLACDKLMAAKGITQHTELSQLIKFILEHNNFIFNDRHYLQVKGTAMGTRMAPSYANIFMHYLEQQIITLSPCKPCFYVRYIDDIFMLWDKGEKELNNFFSLANDFHGSIKFTTQSSTDQIPFLDILVMI